MAEQLGFQDFDGYQYPPPHFEELINRSSVQTHRDLDSSTSRLGQNAIAEAREEQSNLETDATDEQGPHGPYQYCKDVPIDLVLLAYDAETHRKERAAASTESAECIPVTPVNTQDHETIVSPIAGDTYPASSTWDLAPVPAMALASSPSSFLSPSSLGGDPSVQTDPHSRQERLDRMIKRMGGFTHRGKTPQGLPKTRACEFVIPTKVDPSNAAMLIILEPEED